MFAREASFACFTGRSSGCAGRTSVCVYGCRRGTSEASAGRGSQLRESTWRLSTSTLNFVSLDNDLFCHDASSSEKHPQRFCEKAPLICSNDFGHQLQSDTEKREKR